MGKITNNNSKKVIIMTDNFKLKKESLGDQVSDILKTRIQNGEWEIGQRIPSENDLASFYGVSRLTVRLALQKLISLGMLETRVGEGTFVKEFDYQWYMNEIAGILIKPEMLDDIQGFRRLIEIECGRLAIETASNEQIEQLLKASNVFDSFIYDASKGMDYNVEKHASIDYDFHYKLCEISNNSLLTLSYSIARKPIIQYLKTIIKSRWENYFESFNIAKNEDFKLPTKSHLKMAIAIRDKDFERYKEIYYKMVDYKDTKYYFESMDKVK